MRAEKQFLLDEIKDKIQQSDAFFITRYGAINPNLASQFRMALVQAGGEFEVVRKRILIKAAESAGVSIDASQLEGHIGVVFATEEPLQTAKLVFKFQSENEGLLQVVAGRFEGQMYLGSEVEQLSKLPSKTEMRAQFLGLLEAVPAQTLGVMDALLTSLVYCLDNKSKN